MTSAHTSFSLIAYARRAATYSQDLNGQKHLALTHTQVPAAIPALVTKPVCGCSGKVSIYAEDQGEPVSVDCTATIVSSTFEVMDSQGAVMSQVDFGALHYGDNKQVSFSVLNNGPKPARFFAACGTPQQLAEDTDASTPRDDPMTAFIQVCSLLHIPSSSGAEKRFNCCYHCCCC